MIYPKNFFEGKNSTNHEAEKVFSVFVVMPFAKQFTDIYNKGIKHLIHKMEMKCIRADELFRSKPIMEDILNLIYDSEIIIADTTGRNPNVFYELGISHTTKESVIIISQSLDDVPFDLRHLRCLIYSPSKDGLKQLQFFLFKTILEIIRDGKIQDKHKIKKSINQINKQFQKYGKKNPISILLESTQKVIENHLDAISKIYDTVSLSTLSNSINDFNRMSKRFQRASDQNVKKLNQYVEKLRAKNAKTKAEIAKNENAG